MDGIIHTFAGNGDGMDDGDGGPATGAGLGNGVWSVAPYDGSVYIGDGDNSLREVNSSGIISTLAPTNGEASPFLTISSIAVNAGGVYAVDEYNKRVVDISASGNITLFAGDGVPNFFGDGGPATSAGLDDPQGGIANDGSGNTYIADTNSQRVRKVTPDGIIHTLAGNGSEGFGGDGGPAINASLDQPMGLAVDNAGNVYIADSQNSRIRRVDPNGTITTFAGTGTPGFNNLADIGDGGLAVDAIIGLGVSGVAVDQGGNVYIADGQNFRIREVSDGIITTVAGDGLIGSYGDGDGGAATSASFNALGLAVDKDGSVYICQQH